MTVRRGLLRGLPIFADLSDGELDELSQSLREVHYPKGTIMFYEGDPGDSLLIIVTGKVKVVLLGEGGKEIILTILGPGSFFGELSLIEAVPRSATVISLEQSTFLQLKRAAFVAALESNPPIAMNILKHSARRIRELTEEIRSMTMFDIYGRVVRCLVKLAQQEGHRDKNRIFVASPPSHQNLARMIGCTRESVSRAMKTLESTNYLVITKSGIWIQERALKQYWPSL